MFTTSNLLSEKWSKALGRVHDKVGHFLNNLNSWKKAEHTPERITANTLPAFIKFWGPSLDMHETHDELVIRIEVPGLNKDDFSVELVCRLN